MTISGVDSVRFTIGRKIGTGANSNVHEVTLDSPVRLRSDPSKPRVVKITTPDNDDAFAFLAAKTTTLFELPAHPNVMAYDSVSVGVPEPRSVAAVMPRYAGDLSAYAARRRGRRTSVATALCIAEQLASGLAHLHRHGVWHLDVSFGNVLVDDLSKDEPHVVVMDLENSKVLPGEPPSADFTMDFASPERADGARCSDKSDVFSLGVLLYALATSSEFPGVVDGIPELGAGFLNQPEMTPARTAAVVHRDLPQHGHLAALIAMALNHDPSTRVSMEHMRRAVTHLRSGGRLVFPEVLAPIGLRLLPPALAAKVMVNNASGTFDVSAPCCKCGRPRHVDMKMRTDCASGDLHMPGYICPGSTRGPAAMHDRPERAAQEEALPSELMFHFLYPMTPDPGSTPREGGSPESSAAGADGFVRVVDDSNPINALQIHGGFAIARTEAGTLPAASVVTMEPVRAAAPAVDAAGRNSLSSLAFTAAQAWPSECTAVLLRTERVHSPIPALLGTGTAKCFAWIRPGESFTLTNGEVWQPAKEGGFVFWFNESPLIPHELDRYFAVAATGDLVPPAGQHEEGGRDGATSARRTIPGALLRFANNIASDISTRFAPRPSSSAFRPSAAATPADPAGTQQQQQSPPDSTALTDGAAAEHSLPPAPIARADAHQDESSFRQLDDSEVARATAAAPSASAPLSSHPSTAASVPAEAHARAPPLPITLHVVEVPVGSIRIDGDRWTCPVTGEAGEVGQRRMVVPVGANLLNFDHDAVVSVALLRVTDHAGGGHDRLFTQHGVAGFAADGTLAGVMSLRIATDPIARVMSPSCCGGIKIGQTLPADVRQRVTANYAGDDAPVVIDDVPGVTMFALHVSDDGRRMEAYYATADRDAWQVRRLQRFV